MPRQADRSTVAEMLGEGRFLEVFVDTDVDLCRERRPGASFDEFEPPAAPDLRLTMDDMQVEKAVDEVIALLQQRGQVVSD